jgi:hypothetical protein
LSQTNFSLRWSWVEDRAWTKMKKTRKMI